MAGAQTPSLFREGSRSGSDAGSEDFDPLERRLSIGAKGLALNGRSRISSLVLNKPHTGYHGDL